MKNVLIAIIFGLGLVLTSCSKGGRSNPQPLQCEQGGEEVTP